MTNSGTTIRRAALAAALTLGLLSGCAGLQQIIQPPDLSLAAGYDSQVRLAAPSASRPLGGATVRLWTRVHNPNSFGFTIASLAGNLFLEGTRAADVTLPLGLPLVAGQDTVIPIDITVSFADVPSLGDAALRALTGGMLAYRLDGTIGVDAGPLGTPEFGPQTWLRGELDVTR